MHNSSDAYALLGGRALISCRVQARPAARVWWQRGDGSQVEIRPPYVQVKEAKMEKEQMVVSELIVNVVEPRHMGLDRCVAHNSFGSSNLSMSILKPS